MISKPISQQPCMTTDSQATGMNGEKCTVGHDKAHLVPTDW